MDLLNGQQILSKWHMIGKQASSIQSMPDCILRARDKKEKTRYNGPYLRKGVVVNLFSNTFIPWGSKRPHEGGLLCLDNCIRQDPYLNKIYLWMAANLCFSRFNFQDFLNLLLPHQVNLMYIFIVMLQTTPSSHSHPTM